ncbi:MAG TPA: hypothetical protein VHL11_16630 [Phototrophicaceae bacterium]|jgi:hypothetical protein|nr:hypothetical protein [Phototrophicaceae bacterium]
MGLPARWTDPEYGVCLTLWAAIAHLKAAGATCTSAKNTIHCSLPRQAEQIIEAVYIPAAGWVYPLSLLENSIKPDAK